MKVFISSTFKDLKEYRQKAIDVVNRYKCVPLAMELFGARTEEATTVCDKEIRECDVFIGIYAHRYGYAPEGQTKSITQMEYELAKKEGKDCLCFIMDKDFPWPSSAMEMDKYAEIKAFLGEVKKARVVESFKSPDHFMGVLSTSLGNHIAQRTEKPGEDKESTCYIPRAPFPYMAHPYACRSILPAGWRRWPCFPTGSLMKRNRCW